MAKGIRLGAASLVQRYGVPEAAARRIARLCSAKVDVTEAVLRAAASDRDLAALLASPRLGRAARSLDTERVQALREELGLGGAAFDLVVEPKRRWRTLAFHREQHALPALRPVAVSAPMKPSDIETLFSADEVRRLKLIVLTSAEPKERITAIRRLVLAPGSARDKGAVLLAALSDDDLTVRLEAIKALVPLGLDPDIAREARLLVSGTDKQKRGAAGRVGDLAARAGHGEVSVLLTLAAGTLRTELPDAARRALIESLAAAAPVLANDPDQLAGAVALLAEQLTERPIELARPVHHVLAALARENPGGAVDALEAEVGRVPDDQARRLLLGAFSGVHVPPARRPRIAAVMVRELLAAAEPETDCLGIANCLCAWGETAAHALTEPLGGAARQQKTFMLRILDDIGSRPDCPPRTKRAVAETFLAMLKTDAPTTRAALLECEMFADPALPDPLQAAIAAELIQHVHEFGGPRMIGIIEDTLVKLGVPAVPPLVEVLTEGVRDRERVSAARVLGEIVARLPGTSARSSRLGVETLMRCVRQLDGGFPDRDTLAAAIGRMCTSPAMPADTVRRVARGLRVRVGKEPYSFGLLDGLGRLASSPNVELEIRVEVAESLLRLLEVDLPEMQSKRFTGGEKTIFIAGTEAAAYTDMIPILLDGLGNVCRHAGSAALRDRIVAALIHKWHEASSWRLVWGPANTLKLAEVLGQVARAPNAGRDARLDIAEALVSGPDLVPVLRVIGPLLATEGRSARMGALAAQVGERLLARLAPGSGDRIELGATLTGALAAIAARRALGPKDAARRQRRAIAGVLFDALRNAVPGARAALETLAGSPAVPPALRAEIEARLGRG